MTEYDRMIRIGTIALAALTAGALAGAIGFIFYHAYRMGVL